MGQEQRWQLVAERLARAGGKDGHGRLICQQALNHFALTWAEGLKAEVLFEGGFEGGCGLLTIYGGEVHQGILTCFWGALRPLVASVMIKKNRSCEMALYDQNLNQKINALPPEMQQEVVDFVEFLASKYLRKNQTEQPLGDGSPDAQISDVSKSESNELSAYDMAQRLGLVGIFNGPGDLSTNKAYFEDFGK
jgi:hypothetical protein